MRWLLVAVAVFAISAGQPARAQGPAANALEHVAINVSTPPLDNPLLRQAIASAIDRVALLVAIRSRLPATWTSASPATSWFTPSLPQHNPDVSVHRFDRAAARDLLARAGFPEGKGLPEVQISYQAPSAHRQAAAEVLKTQLDAVGIKVKVAGVPGFNQQNLPRRQFELAIFGWLWGPGENPLEPFLPTHQWNYYGYRNAEVVRLITEASGEQNAARRIALQREAERIVLTEAPVIPLYYVYLAPR